MKLFLVICTIFLVSGMVHGQSPALQVHYKMEGNFALPDSALTPGAFNPYCEANLNKEQYIVNGVEENICASNFKTGPIRKSIKNFPKLKKTACDNYGLDKCDGSVEGDHFEPLELCGCPDCQTNIWPQPMKDARVKDHQIEDKLGGPKGLVCQGKISLKDAQSCIATDWVACMKQISQLEK